MELSPWWEWDLFVCIIVGTNAYMLNKIRMTLKTRIEDECERVRRETEARVIAEIQGRVSDISRRERTTTTIIEQSQEI